MLSNEPCEMMDRTCRKSRALRAILLTRAIGDRGRIVMGKEDNLHFVQGTLVRTIDLVIRDQITVIITQDQDMRIETKEIVVTGDMRSLKKEM